MAIPSKRFRPSRLTVLAEGGGWGPACNGAFFSVLGWSIPTMVGWTILTEPPRTLGSWAVTLILYPIYSLASLGVFHGFARHLWKAIPRGIRVRCSADTRAALSGIRYLLVLYSFHEYQDLLRTSTVDLPLHATKEGFDPSPTIEHGLENELMQLASAARCEVLRVWRRGAAEAVEDGDKAIRLLCPDRVWPEVVREALDMAACVIVVPGEGDGLAWERKVIEEAPSYMEKTVVFAGDVNRVSGEICRIVTGSRTPEVVALPARE